MPPRSRRLAAPFAARLAAAATLLLTGACGDSGSGVEPPKPPRVVTDSLAVAAVGIPYAVRLEAMEGDGDYRWAVTAGQLPQGLVLDAPTGRLTGTPTTGGTARFTLEVTSAALTGTAPLSITVHEALGIATTDIPTGVEGVAYTVAVQAEGGDGAPTFGVVSGLLPAGLALDSVTGALEGVPAHIGVSYFTVRVWNDFGQVAERPFSIVIHPPLAIAGAALPGAQVGSFYSRALVSSGGGGGAVWSLAAGALPAGLTLTAEGVITGVPTAAGTRDFTVQVESEDGQRATAERRIEVHYPPVRITSGALPPAMVGTEYTRALAATGGDGAYTFEVIAGVLPPGLAMGPDGRIAGVPTAAGRAEFIVQVASAGLTASQRFAIQVSPAMSQCALPAPQAGFDIHLCYKNAPSPHLEAAFANAVARWESLIVGDLPSVPPNPSAATTCWAGRILPELVGVIDDLVIHVVIEPIDGEHGVLGAAGPCFVRNSNLLTTIGFMIFDSADVDRLAAEGQLEDVIVHEMGHVLGLGTLWEYKGLLREPAEAGVTNPTLFDTWFAGPAAMAAFDAAGGGVRAGNRVPVQNVGNPGAINGHWRESVLDRELMTPFLDIGVFNPLSAISIASLADLGYQIDLGAADPYTVPFPQAQLGDGAAREGARIELVDDIVRVPIRVVDDEGVVVRIVPLPGGGR